MQYIRENYSEYTQKLTGVKKRIFVLVSKYLRPWDKAPRHYDHIIYNSHYTKSIAEKIYAGSLKLETWSEISYPKLNPLFHSEPVAKEHEILDYVVSVGRLVNFIRETDLVIKLANELSLNLIVLGDGPDADYLKSLAGPTITFLGNISDTKTKIDIIKKSRGLINLAKESCGMATMEALLLWVPVFGYNAGGSKELVDNESGILVDTKDLETLCEEFETFYITKYKRSNIKNLTTFKLWL
jgi:glycosyltransferase involved in cell wall biosynthesis